MSLCLLPPIDIFPVFRDGIFDVFDSIEEGIANIEEDLAPLQCHDLDVMMPGCPETEEEEDESHQLALSLNVSGFKPEDLNVNLHGRTLTIEGKQETEEDEDYFMSSFIHRWELPEDIDVDQIRSSITEDGHLTVEAPKVAKPDATGRSIPIQKDATEN